MDPRTLAAMQQLRGELSATLSQNNQAIADKLNAVSSDVNRLNVFKTQNPGGFTVYDIPCQRRPHWSIVEQAFQAADQQVVQASSQSTSDGSFIIEQIIPLWVPTDLDAANYPDMGGAIPAVPADYIGRVLPASAVTLMSQLPGLLQVNGMNAASFSDVMHAITPIPEFDFEFQTAGDSRTWNQGRIPSAALYGGEFPYRLPMPGWLNNRENLAISITPTRPIPNDGTLRLVLQGWKAMGVDSVDGELNRLAVAARSR